MARRWIKTKYAGVRYRESESRKHGLRADRYYSLTYWKDGKTVSEGLGWSSEGMTADKANAVLSQIKEAIRTGKGASSLGEMRATAQAEREAERRTGLTLQAFWDEDYAPALKNRVKATSSEKEESHFKHWLGPHLGRIPLREIRDVDLERVQDRMREAKLSPRTQEYILGTFRRIWKHAAKRKIVNPLENPVARISMPKVNNCRLRAVTPDELRAILEELEIRDRHARDITLFAAFTGCRASEAFNLKWEHVDLVREAVLFPLTKNRDAREVFLAPELMEVLKSRGPGATGQHVFTKEGGSPWKEAPSAFRTAVMHLGLNESRSSRERISFHSLRHSAATIAARRGVPVKDMQVIFGWKTPAMVFRYAKGSEDVQRQAMQGLAKALTAGPGKVVQLPVRGRVSGEE